MSNLDAVQAALDDALERVSEVADPVERERLARQASAVMAAGQEALRRTRTGAVASVREDSGMTVRTAALVLGLSHAQTHRLSTAD